MKLIYVMDPLCGWCYGNIQNTAKLFAEFGKEMEFEILPAGMWAGNQAKKQDPQMANYFILNDKRIAQMTGTEFGEAYFNFIQKETVVLDSEVPSRAIAAVKSLSPEKVIPFAIEVQKARYFFGKDLNKEQTYLAICQTLSIDQKIFSEAFVSEKVKNQTQETFAKASKLADSYPTLLLEKDGKFYMLEQGYAAYSEIAANIRQMQK